MDDSKSSSRSSSSLLKTFGELLFKSTPFAMTAKFARGQIAHILTSEGLLRGESESQRPADQTAGSFLILRSNPTCSKTERTCLPLTSRLKELENLRTEQGAAIPMVVLQMNSLPVTNYGKAFLSIALLAQQQCVTQLAFSQILSRSIYKGGFCWNVHSPMAMRVMSCTFVLIASHSFRPSHHLS